MIKADQWVGQESTGKAYHLNINQHEIANNIIIVGDPKRVGEVATRFDKVLFKTENREFSTILGEISGKPISVISSGIGVDNIDILLNEIEHTVNGNPTEKRRNLNFIRLGTTGTVQEDIKPEEKIISAYAIGTEGLMHYYDFSFNEDETAIANKFNTAGYLPEKCAQAYCVAANRDLLNLFPNHWRRGITLTANGFFGPQFREGAGALSKKSTNIIDLSSFSFQNLVLTNIEMECSGIYGLAKLFNHKAVTICTVLANRYTGEIAKDISSATNQLIDHSLEEISARLLKN